MTTPSTLCLAALLICQIGEPKALDIPHPDDPSKQVEYFVASPKGEGPWPTVVLLHGHQEAPRPGAKEFVEWGVLEKFARRGYLAVAVSQPGYGGSDGPADFCGPFTQHAVTGVIAKLRAEGSASPDKLLLQGVSRGALTAGLIATEDPSVSGLVMISGVYDLPAYASDADPNAIKRSILASIEAETGGGAASLEARSVIRRADKIEAATLILGGAKDERTDPEQARLLADAIERAGGEAKVVLYPDLGHRIPVETRDAEIDPFIDRVLKGEDASRPGKCIRRRQNPARQLRAEGRWAKVRPTVRSGRLTA